MADHAEISAKRGAIHDRFLTVVSSSPFMCPSPAIAKIQEGGRSQTPDFLANLALHSLMRYHVESSVIRKENAAGMGHKSHVHDEGGGNGSFQAQCCFGVAASSPQPPKLHV